MMLGHALFAFAAVAAVASRRVEPREALVVGVVAGLFAGTPDVDVLFALPGLFDGAARLVAALSGPASGDVFTVTGSFWAASTAVHRSVTHSLVVAAFAAVGAGLLGGVGGNRGRRVAGAAVLAVPVALAAVVSGSLAAAMVGATVVAAGTVAVAAGRRGLSGRTIGLLAAAGLGSHPFGDLFTGQPPQLLYPLATSPVAERVAVAADPTLHLLAVFGLEVVAAWAALAVAFRLTGRSLAGAVRPVALLATGYGPAALVVTPPTLETSYHFVFSVLAVGVASAAVAARATNARGVDRMSPSEAAATGGSPRSDGGSTLPSGGLAEGDVAAPERRDRLATAAATGVAAVTLAWGVYAVVYASGVGPL